MFSSLSSAIQSFILGLTALTLALFPTVAVRHQTTTPNVSAVGTPAPIAGNGNGQSTNWAGYVSTGGTFTGVSASWTISTPTSGQMSADASWIGIGGVGSSDLVQVGTENDVSSSGQVNSAAFYELLPNGSQPMTGVTIAPGDAVTASISEPSAGQWALSFTDKTNGDNFSQTFPYTSAQSSAEWIEEDPASTAGQVPLDNFGKIQFTAGSAVENGNTVNISGAGAQSVTMINSAGQALATPSSVGSGGTSFTVTRSSVTSGASVSGTTRSWSRRGAGLGRGHDYSATAPPAPNQSQDESSGSRWSHYYSRGHDR